MGDAAAQHPELSRLDLPRRGLESLLRGWSGDGHLFDALASVRSEDGLEIDWSAADLRRRASRVVLSHVEVDIMRLPLTARRWRESLPVTTEASRLTSPRFQTPVDWSATARRFGWPPQAYVTNPRNRVQDETAIRALAWTARRIEDLVRDVGASAPVLMSSLAPCVDPMLEVARTDLRDVDLVVPDRLDLRSLAGSGEPWGVLAKVASRLVAARDDLELLAFELLQPDPEFEWRLFHLSVLGEVLRALRKIGARVSWLSPLTDAGTSGPQFRVNVAGHHLDLWFEAAGAPSHYGYVSTYRAATAGVRRGDRAIGADLMLTGPFHGSFLLECKWSASPTYVGREGYYQAAAYALELWNGRGSRAVSYVVGPEEVVPARSAAAQAWGSDASAVGVCNINHVEQLVSDFLGVGGHTDSP